MSPLPDNVRVVLSAEEVEHYRATLRPLLDRLKAFFGMSGDPVVTAKSRIGHFFDWIQDEAVYREKWQAFAATLPVPIAPTDLCSDVAKRMAAAGESPVGPAASEA